VLIAFTYLLTYLHTGTYITLFKTTASTFTSVSGKACLTLTHKTLSSVDTSTATTTRDLQTVGVLRERTSTTRRIMAFLLMHQT